MGGGLVGLTLGTLDVREQLACLERPCLPSPPVRCKRSYKQARLALKTHSLTLGNRETGYALSRPALRHLNPFRSRLLEPV